MKFNIQTKLFIALAGLTILILAGVLFLVTGTVNNQIQSKIISDFNNTQTIFSQQQNLVYRRLLESSWLIGANSTFIANVTLNDPASVLFSVQEFSDFARVDLFTVTDKAGKVLARLHDPDVYGDDLSSKASVFIATNGEIPDEEQEWPELWGIEKDIYQVVSQPIWANEFLVGTLTLGRKFTEIEAVELKAKTNIDITFFYDERLLGSTLDPSKHVAMVNFVQKHKAIIDTTLFLLQPTPAFIDTIAGVENYTFISPLGRGEPAYYIASIPTALELQVLTGIQNNILTTAAIFFAITLFFAFFLGNNFSRPILKLATGMNEVKAGNLDIAVKPSTKDEIGLLTQTFNEMITGLRERLHLSRYVGSHTLEMVQKTSSSKVSLGGTRQNLSVLFSDVRGFTEYSESRDPEEVINMLNRYLGLQAEIVTRYNGSVDKYVGDEMFALFTGEESTERAIACAIEIQKRIAEENKNTNKPVEVGIGVNYGPVILGNMGAQDRMDYTALGATVNLGARLCSAAKPGQILIRKDLFDNLKTNVKIGGVYLINFKGITEKLKIVEVLSE
jgi:class 3 adenylate cyclase